MSRVKVHTASSSTSTLSARRSRLLRCVSYTLPVHDEFPPLVAEVQAHSSHQSRAEMDQLREQLLDAFRKQMEIRRNLMELENSNMEVQIDTSKHLLTIAESVFTTYVFLSI